ncbi:MAG: UDP-glucose dehydrogenase family protein [Nitrosotalea sp.]
MNKPRISVIGLGFVGLSLSVANAKCGFSTIGVDINEQKIDNLKKGIPDFFEPKLKNMLKRGMSSELLEFTNDIEKAILSTDLTFLTVGTPPTKNGKIDLSQIKKVVAKISQVLQKKKRHHLLIVKSTVAPQTTENTIKPICKSLIDSGKLDLVVNPEFLREGSAIDDIFKPHLIVIGAYNKNAGNMLENYYRRFYSKIPEIIHTDPTTAEFIKYSNNAFLATKISFINSIANICQQIPNVDVNAIANAIGKDSRIGSLFLQAGPGFGGSCIPKDLSALIDFSNKFGKKNTLFKAVKEVNDTQPLRIVELMKKLKVLDKNKTISILGLAFKKDTDDVREAISVKVVRDLIKKELKIKVHDPMAMNNFRTIFQNKIIYCNTVDKCLEDSDCCVILTEWDEYKKLNPSNFKNKMKQSNIIDARRILEPHRFSRLNFMAIGLGKS